MDTFEDRSRKLFLDSVDDVDMRVRSRLTQARHAALDAALANERRPWLRNARIWAPGLGVTAAVLLGAAIWFAVPGLHGGASADGQGLEDLEIVAAADESSGDALEMLQNDLDFYAFADKAAGAEPSA